MCIKGIDTVIAGASCLAAAIHDAETSPCPDTRHIEALRQCYLWSAERITSEAVRQLRAKRGRRAIPPVLLRDLITNPMIADSGMA